MSRNPPFSSQAKLSAAATLDLPALNWQPDLLFLPQGVCTMPYLYRGGKNAIKRWHKHWAPVVAMLRKREGVDSCHCDMHAETALLIGLYTLQHDSGVNRLWLGLNEWALTGDWCPTLLLLVYALSMADPWPCIFSHCRQLPTSVSLVWQRKWPCIKYFPVSGKGILIPSLYYKGIMSF